VDPSNPATSELGQHDVQGNFGLPVSAAVNSQYSSWFTKTKTATATATVSATNTATATATFKSIPFPTDATFDYVVVGGGAGGVPMADKLSETGKTTLLIERGPPSSGRWGGSKSPWSKRRDYSNDFIKQQ
jgi:cellobiose dehydrogenase (acceptor)